MLLTGFGMLVLVANLYLMEFLIGYFALFCLFLAVDGFKWFCVRSLYKNIQLMLEFFKDPINDLPHVVICDIAVYVDSIIFYSKCDLGSNLC